MNKLDAVSSILSQNAKWGHAGFYIDRHRMTSLLTCAWLIRPPIKNQNMRTGKYSFTKKALSTTSTSIVI